MLSIVISFFASFIVVFFIVKFSHKHGGMLDHDVSGVQKNHFHPVPRIGGLGIFLATLIGVAATYLHLPVVAEWIFVLILCGCFAFGCGFIEDLTKNVSPIRRLIFTMISAVVAYFFLKAGIFRIDIAFIDGWLSYAWLSLPLTVLAVAGIANAINIIDGFNGLASVVSMFMMLSLAYVAWQVGDTNIMISALILVGAIGGFFVWNYPFGLIFLGDGGAYFTGFMLGELTVLLIARNPQVSAWYAVLLLIYPIFETLFSIYRRKFVRGVSPGLPDGVHLHSLIFKRLVRWTIGRRDAKALTRRNSLTSPYLWLISLLAVLPATLFWKHQIVLMICCLIFVVGYIWLYAKIVRFKSPRWMILRKKK